MAVRIPPALALRPFTLAEARSLGLTRDQLKGARFVRPYPGVYIAADLPFDGHVGVQAAQLAVVQDCPASYETGLALYGVGAIDPDRIHLSTRHWHPRRIRGIEVHRHQHLGTILIRQGCTALVPERCLVDAATDLGLAEVVASGEGLVALGRTTLDRLQEFVIRHHYDGIIKARRAVELMVPDSESFRESYVRVMLVLAGLPAPQVNFAYGDPVFLARLDLSYAKYKIAIEYDGRQHGLSLAQRERDIRRREAMEAQGWVFIVITAAQLARRKEIVNRVYAALVARGHTGPRPTFHGEWSRTFDN